MCVCVEAGWRADLARALGERGRGNEETTAKGVGGGEHEDGGFGGGARSGHYRASIRALKQGQNKQFVCCVFTRD